MAASTAKTGRHCSIRHLTGLVLLVLVILDSISTTESISRKSTKAPLPSAEKCLLDKYRVPYSVYPDLYKLSLQINMHSSDPKNFTYNGTVVIRVKCTAKTNKIVLHSTVSSVHSSSIKIHKIRLPVGEGIGFEKVEIDSEKEFFTIFLNEDMVVGNTYQVSLQFSGPIGNVSEGIYYTSYKQNGETRYVIYTKFHPVHARKVFPCFDEPAMKATFSLTIMKPAEKYHVLSNTRGVINNANAYEVDGVTYDSTIFNNALKMSTSAIGFIISDFEITDSLENKKITYIGYRKQGSLINSTFLALDMTIAFSNYFRVLFGVNYNLPTQVLVGFPEFDDTKNFGLKFVKESRLVSGTADHNTEDEDIVVRNMGYLSAYEWLGNIVTPRWWDDAWLADGLAGYYEHSGQYYLRSDLKTWHHFIMDKLQVALKHDSTFDSRPVYRSIETPAEIEKLFDWVIFRKAPCLVRMLVSFLGAETLDKAMKQYFKKHKSASASHETLFRLFDKEAKMSGLDINVTAIMETWILQINYPVVTVTRDFKIHNALVVTQERFLTNPTTKDPDKYPSPFNYRWTIPLTIVTSSNSKTETKPLDIYWITKDQRMNALMSDKFISKDTDKDPWILANVNQTGYYRVNYQEGNWLALIRQLKSKHADIYLMNRAQIIDDAFNLARANQLPLNLALQTIEYLKNEQEFLPWFTGWQEISYMDAMLSYTPLYGGFQALMKVWLSSAFHINHIQKLDRDHMIQLTQSLLAQLACRYGVESCVTSANEQFKVFHSKEDKSGIIVSARKAVYCQGVASGEWDEWKFVLKMYKKAEVESEKDNLLSALACTSHPWILRHYLDMMLEEDSPFSPDIGLKIITSVIKNANGRYLAWDFYRTKYEELKERYPVLACDLAIASITENFNTVMERDEVTLFYLLGCTDYFISKFSTQILDKINSNIAWLAKNLPVMRLWLNKHEQRQELPHRWGQ